MQQSNLKPLGKLGKIVSGSTPKTFVEDYWNGDIPWITPANLTSHQGIYFTGKLRKITQAGYDSCSTTMLPAGSILFSSRAPIGHCAVTAYPLCTNQGFKSIIPNPDELDSVYGFFALKYFTPQIVQQGRGATFAEINKEMMETFCIPLPPLAEQQRIAGILARADRLRQLRRTALQLSEGYLQSVFLQMFGDPVTNPMGWEVVKLGHTFAENPRIGTAVPAHEGGKQKVVRVGEIGERHVALEKCGTITLKGSVLEKFSLLPNDFLLARAIGSEHHLGKASIFQKVDFPVVYDSHVMRLRFDFEKVHPSFFLHWLKSNGGRARFMQRAGRTAVQFNVNTKQIADIDIPLPPISEQMQFVCVVEQFERLWSQQHEAARQANHLFATLLHHAFIPSP